MKITRTQANRDGLTVDDRVYPHVGYLGPRFDPTYCRKVFTEQEANLVCMTRALLDLITRVVNRRYLVSHQDLNTLRIVNNYMMEIGGAAIESSEVTATFAPAVSNV